MDSRIKLGTALVALLFIALTPNGAYYTLLWYGLPILVLLLFSRVPWSFILKRSTAVVPFLFLVTIFIPFFQPGSEGLKLFFTIFLKALLSFFVLLSLTWTTTFPDFIQAAGQMKVPQILLTILFLMYRYLFLIQKELFCMKQAWEVRAFGKRGWRNWRSLAGLLGSLFLRSYERAERVYLAMCSRGYTGKMDIIHSSRIKPVDLLFFVSAGIYLFLVRLYVNG